MNHEATIKVVCKLIIISYIVSDHTIFSVSPPDEIDCRGHPRTAERGILNHLILFGRYIEQAKALITFIALARGVNWRNKSSSVCM